MKRLLSLAVASALCAVGSQTPADAAEVKLLTSWNKNLWPSYAPLELYVKNVAKIGGGKFEGNHTSGGQVQVKISGTEVVPPFEQLQPVVAGVFDMLYTHGVYHMGSKGLSLVLDTIDMDPMKRREVGIHDYIDDYYQKNNNLKLVAVLTAGFSGYHMFLKEPLSPEGDIKGRKIRGTASYHGVIKALGGSPVVLPPAQVYTALEKGVVDGACWPAAGMLAMKHFEVAKYRLRPTFGTTNEIVLMNLDKWRKLTDADRAVLHEAALRSELEVPWFSEQIHMQEDRELTKLGVQKIQFPPDKAKLVKEAWSKSLWGFARKCCGDGADGLRELALKHGMTQ